MIDYYPTGRMARLLRAGRAATSIGFASAGTALARVANGEAVNWREILLAPENASRVVDALGDLRGAAAKIGQLLSMQTDAILPPAWRDAMAQLRDRNEPLGPEPVERLLVGELGANWRNLFGTFDLRPVAAASIAQVHEATLPNGRRLAVKLQYPGIKTAIESDFANLRMILPFASSSGMDSARMAEFLEAAEAQLLEETDFIAEMRSLGRYRDALAPRTDVIVPSVFAELSTSRVLTMSWCDGMPVEEVFLQEDAVKAWFGHLMIDIALQEIFDFGCIQSDPNYANFRITGDFSRLVMLDFGAVIALPETSREQLRTLFSAALEGRQEQVLQAFRAMVGLEDAAGQTDTGMSELCRLVMLPLQTESFDFSDQTYSEALKQSVMQIVERRELPGLERATFAIQRRLSGLFLMCAELGVSLNVRDSVHRALSL